MELWSTEKGQRARDRRGSDRWSRAKAWGSSERDLFALLDSICIAKEAAIWWYFWSWAPKNGILPPDILTPTGNSRSSVLCGLTHFSSLTISTMEKPVDYTTLDAGNVASQVRMDERERHFEPGNHVAAALMALLVMSTRPAQWRPCRALRLRRPNRRDHHIDHATRAVMTCSLMLRWSWG